MNKIELYNKIVKMYKATGQGTPTFVVSDRSLIDELVKNGLIKIVTQSFNYLPSAVDMCLTKGYCVEENMPNKDSSVLTYMKIYMNIDPVIDLGSVCRVSLKEAIKNPEFMIGYSEWLNINKEKLAEIEKIEFLDETIGDELNEDTIEYLKNRDCYKKNQIVSKCLIKLIENDDNIKQQFLLYDSLIDLLKTDIKYKEKLEENLKEREELINEQKKSNQIKNWLSNKNSNEKIQNII